MESGMLFVLMLCLITICYSKSLPSAEMKWLKAHLDVWHMPPIKTFITRHKKVKGSGIIKLRYVYLSDYGSNCIVDIVDNKEKVTVEHQHSCEEKTNEAGRVAEGNLKESPMRASEYLEEKVTTWRIPPITKFIDTHKKVADGKTVEQYMYISDNNRNCTVTVVRDNKSKLMTDRTWLCIKVVKLSDTFDNFPSTHSIIVKFEQEDEEEKGIISVSLGKCCGVVLAAHNF
ncbi:hypothetical protein GE061_018252 [Apolygus lucorum]|uniref:Lipocalin/cytosolic fatty-acid binding domain-containing protein n=1 Tax=Apolygus lucorum TaxID=248454 RepID=A0A8S9XER3_APOLU|nr:hypothetical protein GE061_018252 [Apolygus lucorum]